MLIDTHCHLIDEAFTKDVEACVVRAQQANVGKIMQACCDETEFSQILQLSEKYPDVLFTSIGIHPENLAPDVKEQLKREHQLLVDNRHRIKAIGEIGLDLYWDKSRIADQRLALEQQLIWSAEYGLPVLLHIREAMPEFLSLLHNTNDTILKRNKTRIRGILHCYSGTAEEALEALKYGDFLFGIGGTVTYKRSKVSKVALALGLDKIVLETDAPYLAPVPHRGKRNEPAYTALTAQYLATLFDVPLEEVEAITTRNAIKMLSI